MKIVLRRGKQRELIKLAKGNLSWNKFSKIIEIHPNYISGDLRREKTLLYEKQYKKLCRIANKNFNKFIVEKLEVNWGKIKGGRLSNGKTKQINFPKESVKLAEFYGIMLGDGNLTKIKSYKKGTYQTTIVGDSRHDKNYLIKYVKPLIKGLFNIEVKESLYKKSNALAIKSTSRKLIEFMESKGFKPGNKIKNKLNIPDWIKKNKKFLEVCLRGLYDTDGGIYKLNNQNTYQAVFTNYNKTLIKTVRQALINLGIIPSKVTNRHRLYITKKSELKKFLKHIGFRNDKHLNKIKSWNLAL